MNAQADDSAADHAGDEGGKGYISPLHLAIYQSLSLFLSFSKPSSSFERSTDTELVTPSLQNLR